MKLYHSADATATERLDDEKGMSDVDAGIPSSATVQVLSALNYSELT